MRSTSSPRSAVRRLAAGRLISVTGGAAAYTALNFTVWERTHSPGMQALSLLLTFGVAGIVGPFAGALGDRFDRRRVMIASEAVASAFFIGMVFADDPGVLIGLAFGSAVAELPFFSASRAAIPNLVEGDEDITWANSLITVGVHAGIAVGPVIGGVILGVTGDPTWVFAINAVSFVVSLLITLTVRGRFQGERPDAGDHEGIAAGLVFLWKDRVIRRMTMAWLVFVLGMGMGMVADAPLAEAFDSGGLGFGLLIACWGTGSVIGAAAGRWMSTRSEPLWMVVGAFGVADRRARRRVRAAVPAGARLPAVHGHERRAHDRRRERDHAASHARRRAQPHDVRVRGHPVARPRHLVPDGRAGAERGRAAGRVQDRGHLGGGRGDRARPAPEAAGHGARRCRRGTRARSSMGPCPSPRP